MTLGGVLFYFVFSYDLGMKHYRILVKPFSEVRVARSLVFCVLFCRSLFILCAFSFGHYIVCPFSMICGFWLPFWCLQTFLIRVLGHVSVVFFVDISASSLCKTNHNELANILWRGCNEYILHNSFNTRSDLIF